MFFDGKLHLAVGVLLRRRAALKRSGNMELAMPRWWESVNDELRGKLLRARRSTLVPLAPMLCVHSFANIMSFAVPHRVRQLPESHNGLQAMLRQLLLARLAAH